MDQFLSKYLNQLSSFRISKESKIIENIQNYKTFSLDIKGLISPHIVWFYDHKIRNSNQNILNWLYLTMICFVPMPMYHLAPTKKTLAIMTGVKRFQSFILVIESFESFGNFSDSLPILRTPHPSVSNSFINLVFYQGIVM